MSGNREEIDAAIALVSNGEVSGALDPNADPAVAVKQKRHEEKRISAAQAGEDVKPNVVTPQAPAVPEEEPIKPVSAELVNLHTYHHMPLSGPLAALTRGVMAFKTSKQKKRRRAKGRDLLREDQDRKMARTFKLMGLWGWSLLCVIVAGILALRHFYTGRRFKFLESSMVMWLLLVGLPYPMTHVAEWIVDVFISFLEFFVLDVDRNVSYILIGMATPLRRLLSAIFVEFFVEWVRWQNFVVVDPSTISFLRKLLFCLCIFFGVQLTSRFVCRLLALRVHSETLFTELEEALHSELVLNRMMKQPGPDSFPEGDPRTIAIAAAWDLPQSAVKEFMMDLYELSLPMRDQQLNFTNQMTRLVQQFDSMAPSETDARALNGAEYFWWMSRDNFSVDGLTRLTRANLMKLLEDADEVDYAYSIFDDDGDGFVVKFEVQDQFMDMYRERKNIARTLRDSDQALETIQSLLGSIMHLFAVLAYTRIFGHDISNLLLSLSSISIAGAFVFGNQLRSLYESIVFIFIIQPYKVGDKIKYNTVPHVVKNFGLLTTQLQRVDGARVWVPNEKLMNTDIVNVTHSSYVSDFRKVEVDYKTVTQEMLDDLELRMKELIEKEGSPVKPNLFNTDVPATAHIEEMMTPLKYSVVVYYQLNVSLVELNSVYKARTQVHLVIGEWLAAHNLQHTQSLQPGFMKNAKDLLA